MPKAGLNSASATRSGSPTGSARIRGAASSKTSVKSGRNGKRRGIWFGGVHVPRERSQPPSGDSISSSAQKGSGTCGKVSLNGIRRGLTSLRDGSRIKPNGRSSSTSTSYPWNADVRITIWCRSFGDIAVRPRWGSSSVGCGGSKGSWSGDQIALSGARFERESSSTFPSPSRSARRVCQSSVRPRDVNGCVRWTQDTSRFGETTRRYGSSSAVSAGSGGRIAGADAICSSVGSGGIAAIGPTASSRVDQSSSPATVNGMRVPSGTSNTRRLESAIRATLSRGPGPDRSRGIERALGGVGLGLLPRLQRRHLTVDLRHLRLEVGGFRDRLRREEDDQPGGRRRLVHDEGRVLRIVRVEPEVDGLDLQVHQVVGTHDAKQQRRSRRPGELDDLAGAQAYLIERLLAAARRRVRGHEDVREPPTADVVRGAAASLAHREDRVRDPPAARAGAEELRSRPARGQREADRRRQVRRRRGVAPGERGAARARPRAQYASSRPGCRRSRGSTPVPCPPRFGRPGLRSSCSS